MHACIYRYAHTLTHIHLSGIRSSQYSVIQKLPRYWVLLYTGTNKCISPDSSPGDDETLEWLGSTVLAPLCCAGKTCLVAERAWGTWSRQAPCSALSRVRLGDGPISAERPRVPSFMNTSASNPHSNSKDSIIVPILQARKLRHQEVRILAQVQSTVSGRSVQP